jgi:transposase
MEKRKTLPTACPSTRFPLSHRPCYCGRGSDNEGMRDTDLYATLLGLKTPWEVTRVELKIDAGEVHVHVNHGDHAWQCPECERVSPLNDHQDERVWRHLDTMQYTTLLHARPPRVNCSEHGVRAVRLPWADPKSRFTLLFETFAIQVLLQTSVQAAARLLRLSWDEAFGIQRRAVDRGLRRKEHRPPAYIGIDEKAFRAGQGSYMTLICDLMRGTVEWVAEDRKAEAVTKYLDQFTDDQLAKILGFAVDMWRAYTKALNQKIPDAESKIIYDRFHVMQEINEALDMIRKMESRELLKEGDETLKGSKYLWLRSHENVPSSLRLRFAALRRLKLKTARAWAIKESLRHLWDFRLPSRALAFWKRWYYWATHSQLQPIIRAAAKLKKHEAKILNYFIHRITNSMSESINGRIERLKRIANGFRNKDNFRIAILFRHGGLNLLPVTH